jgi:hypothetical protein
MERHREGSEPIARNSDHGVHELAAGDAAARQKAPDIERNALNEGLISRSGRGGLGRRNRFNQW